MWSALDVFIGLALCYAMLSLICSVVQEFIAQALNSRGKLLVEAFKSLNLAPAIDYVHRDLMANPGGIFANRPSAGWGMPSQTTPASTRAAAAQALADHRHGKAILPPAELAEAQAITTSAPLPSKVPGDVAARAILRQAGILGDNGQLTIGQIAQTGSEAAASFEQAISAANLPPALKTRLLALDGQARGSLAQITGTVESWFNDFMDQVNHWYTRRAQIASLLIALAVALVLKVDTIGMARQLYGDTTSRQAVVQMAGAMVQNQGPAGAACSASGAQIAACAQAVEKAYPLPLGWDFSDHWYAGLSWCQVLSQLDWLKLIGTVAGIVLSGLAISLGSRFWFDTLKSLIAIRTGGNPAPARQPDSSAA